MEGLSAAFAYGKGLSWKTDVALALGFTAAAVACSYSPASQRRVGTAVRATRHDEVSENGASWGVSIHPSLWAEFIRTVLGCIELQQVVAKSRKQTAAQRPSIVLFGDSTRNSRSTQNYVAGERRSRLVCWHERVSRGFWLNTRQG